MDKILEMLGIDKLDESKQTEVKNKLDEIVQVKVDEKAKEKEKELKDQLTEQYEEKFEEYKTDITEKFSNFVDEILDEEMNIPDKVKEYARKGELYEDVIEQFKTRLAIDEGHINDEVKELLKECKTEINTLKENVNSLTSENMELKQDAKEFAANLYLREKCDGLTEKQKDRVLSLLEGVTSKEEIDKKFDVIVESTEDDTTEDTDNLNENNTGKGKDEELVNENDTKSYSIMDY
jgi:hypothetical protein